MNKTTPQETKQIAEEAYLYAFPMLMGYRYAYATFLQPASPAYRGSANADPFGEAVTLDHTYKDVVSANADTPYSMGTLDLRGGPVVLTVPEITDRYYVMQFENLLGHNELFIGSRATGTAAGSYFLMGPSWEGEIPEGFAGSFRFETELVFLLGRTQLLSPDDQPALAEVMRQYRLESYELFQGGEAPLLPSFDWPHWDDPASRDERFIGYMNALLPLCGSIHPSETELFARFASIGIGAGVSFDPNALSDEQRQAIVQGIAAALEALAQLFPTIGRNVNGWTMASACGNRAFFNGDYAMRALTAQVGWGGNDAIEAFYPMSRVDANGKNFDGAHAYQIQWENDPPVNAFWSLTMYDKSYDGAAGYMVKNPINRYLINSTTEGLVRDADGGLTITIQHAEPNDPAQRANWLPAPAEEFYLAMRLYWPESAVLDGTWEPPLVVRVD